MDRDDIPGMAERAAQEWGHQLDLGTDSTEDLIHDICLKLLEEWPEIEAAEPNPTAYAYRIAKNYIIDRLRQQERDMRLQRPEIELRPNMELMGWTEPTDPDRPNVGLPLKPRQTHTILRPRLSTSTNP